MGQEEQCLGQRRKSELRDQLDGINAVLVFQGNDFTFSLESCIGPVKPIIPNA